MFFHSLNTIFCRAKVIHFAEIPIINFSYDRLFFLVLIPKNYLPNWISGRFFLFPAMTLKVLCFHLSLQCILYNFVWSMRYVYTYIFIYIDVQLFQNHFLKRMLLFHWTVFAPFLKLNWPYLWDLCVGSLFCPIDLSFYLMAKRHYLDYYSFIACLKSGTKDLPTFYFFSWFISVSNSILVPLFSM